MEGSRIIFPAPFKIEVERFDLAGPGANEILVETEATLISTGSELTALAGNFPADSLYWSSVAGYPYAPGYSTVGTIKEIGPAVEGFKIGERVAAGTGHASHSVVDVGSVVRVPENVSVEDACFFTIAAGVMNSVRVAGVGLGESVVVVGLGLLGQVACLFSKLAGALPIVGIDLAEERLKSAARSGAAITVRGDNWQSIQDTVRKSTKGLMADTVFEVTGDPDVIPEAIKLVKEQGRLIILSAPRGKTSCFNFHDEVGALGRTIMGANFGHSYHASLYPWTKRRNSELVFDLLSSGTLEVGHLITHKYPWHEAGEAYEMLLEDRMKALGVILQFTS